MEGSIRKRGSKSWELTLDLGRDEKGKRDRRYFTVHGTKKQAQQRLRELLTEVDGGNVPTIRASDARMVGTLDVGLRRGLLEPSNPRPLRGHH